MHACTDVHTNTFTHVHIVCYEVLRHTGSLNGISAACVHTQTHRHIHARAFCMLCSTGTYYGISAACVHSDKHTNTYTHVHFVCYEVQGLNMALALHACTQTNAQTHTHTCTLCAIQQLRYTETFFGMSSARMHRQTHRCVYTPVQSAFRAGESTLC